MGRTTSPSGGCWFGRTPVPTCSSSSTTTSRTGTVTPFTSGASPSIVVPRFLTLSGLSVSYRQPGEFVAHLMPGFAAIMTFPTERSRYSGFVAFSRLNVSLITDLVRDIAYLMSPLSTIVAFTSEGSWYWRLGTLSGLSSALLTPERGRQTI